MSELIERRHAKRVHISCRLQFRILDSKEYQSACCIDLSQSGIAFCSEHDFQVGDKIEVRILPDPPVMFITTLIVRVVRTEHQEDGLLRVGALIDYDEMNSMRSNYTGTVVSEFRKAS